MRPWLRALVGALCLVLLASLGALADATRGIYRPVFADGPPEGESARVYAGELVGLYPIAWQSAHILPGTEGRSIGVDFIGGAEGPCWHLARVDTIERPNYVSVTLYGGSEPPTEKITLGDQTKLGRICFALGILRYTVIRLNAPLAHRALVDCSTGPDGTAPRRTDSSARYCER